jgi:hypothetical protein
LCEINPIVRFAIDMCYEKSESSVSIAN